MGTTSAPRSSQQPNEDDAPETRPLLFVHLSDLHFSSRPTESKWELDQTLRTELRHDLREQVAQRGGATGLLVSGDVAFSGATTEYVKARDFLVNLCVDLAIPTEDVWVVPGNHDIDRSRHDDAPTKAARFEVLAASERRIDPTLERLVGHPETARALLAPLANYLDFAADFGCQPPAEDLGWEAIFAMSNGYQLRIRGVNSAIVSDEYDEENIPQLIVGSVQTQLQRGQGIVYVTVCHHPARWIRDRAQLEAMFDNNAQLQLTGHEHKFGVSAATPLKIAAGALHPERELEEWEPRYNLIAIELISASDPEQADIVRISVSSRIWHKTAARWGRDPAAGTGGEITFDVPLDAVVQVPAPALNAAEERYETPAEGDRVERLVNRRRRLLHRFTRLFDGERRALAERFGVALADVAALDAAGLAEATFAQAERGDALGDLWDAVESAHGIPPDQLSNPFRETS